MSDVNFDTNWVNEYSGDPQTTLIFSKTETLEESVAHILKLSQISQTKLIDMMNTIKTKFEKSVLIYNPKVKSFESALRKVQNATGIPNQILRLNDGYRASLLCSNINDIPIILTEIDALLPLYKFEKMSVLNTFESPWPNGYRDYNCRLQDTDNNNLIGEFQLHFCPIKLFSQTVGHLSYEILRTLNPDDPHIKNVKDALQQIATAGYNSALELNDDCCFDKIKELQKKYDITKVEDHIIEKSTNAKGKKSLQKIHTSDNLLWGYKLNKQIRKTKQKSKQNKTKLKTKQTKNKRKTKY